MAFDFPLAPVVGQLYPDPEQPGLPQYRWDGSAWQAAAGTASDYVKKIGDVMEGHLGLPVGPAAEQAVRRDYVDAAMAGVDLSSKVSKTGDVMSGHLSLPATPAADQAVRKDYVDAAIAAIPPPVAVDISGKVSKTGDTMSGALYVPSIGIGATSISESFTEWGSTSVATPVYFDFHSSGPGSDYDVRVVYNGGWASAGQGSVTFEAAAGMTVTGPITGNGGVSSTASVTWRSAYGPYGPHWHNDASSRYYLMLTNWGDAWGGWNGLRPLTVRCDSGVVDFGGSITTGGAIQLYSFNSHAGIGGAYGSSQHNFEWTNGLRAWVDVTMVGILVFSDYRTKKDVVELPSTWETVKNLRPVKYTHQDFSTPSHQRHQREVELKAAERAELQAKGESVAVYNAVEQDTVGPLIIGDDIERWGFLAHELQETLVPSAATGEKDSDDVLQSPDPFTIIAALTKTLQEAQARIESVEAQIAALVSAR